MEAAARSLEEQQKVDLIYAIATSVTRATKRATNTVPIVFYGGTDPVAVGLVESFRKPGGRLTGVYGRFTDLTAKRLELLKEMIPNLPHGTSSGRDGSACLVLHARPSMARNPHHVTGCETARRPTAASGDPNGSARDREFRDPRPREPHKVGERQLRGQRVRARIEDDLVVLLE